MVKVLKKQTDPFIWINKQDRLARDFGLLPLNLLVIGEKHLPPKGLSGFQIFLRLFHQIAITNEHRRPLVDVRRHNI